jgi:hypothetical protein
VVETGLPNRRITTGRQVCHPDSEKALDLSRAVSAPKPAFSIEIDLVGNKYRVTLDDGAPRRARCQCRFSPAELSDIYKSLCKRPEAVMADTTVDVGAVFGGIFLPGSVSDRVAKAYDEVLFKGAMLRDLPDDSEKKAPRFVINATNVQTAALWRFSRPYMGDYRVGLVDAPDVRLCSAVAASSAFRPILSPMTLPITQPVRATKGADLNRPPYTIQAVLSEVVVSTIISDWKPSNGFQRCLSVTLVRRLRLRKARNTIGRGTRCASSTRSTIRSAAYASGISLSLTSGATALARSGEFGRILPTIS